MRTAKRNVAWRVAVLCLAACSTQHSDDEQSDTDSGPQGDATAMGEAFSACEVDNDCSEGLFCDEELENHVDLVGFPKGVELPLFPGGSCSPRSLAPYDPTGDASCDYRAAAGKQGCGKTGKCVIESPEPAIVSCRAACEPSATQSGCARDYYTCDFELRACVEGCREDAECRVQSMDTDGDGAPDTLTYNASSRATCDHDTARCTHAGGATESGGACDSIEACEADGACIRELSSLAGQRFPGGLCTKFGCNVPGRECAGEHSVCAPLRSLSPAPPSAAVCLTSCRVGAEAEALRLGETGHGEGCRSGYRCHYNGTSAAENGVCVGGVYNAIKKNNLGDSCTGDDQCYSPYGYGRCLILSVGDVQASVGMCSILDCGAPGLPKDICGPTGACVGLGADVSYCARECKAASECSEGSACADDDLDPATPNVCYPGCLTDGECRKTEQCELGASGVGQCVAMSSKGE